MFADSESDAAGRIDLLSVIMHELTHVLEARFPESDFHFGESVTSEMISAGQRFHVYAPVGGDDDDDLDDLWADDPAQLLDSR
ncbi:MAG: hypothetical protein R3C19_15440 [Planctomycetaceae bacterium]